MADGTAIIIVNETVKVKDNETVRDKRRGADTDFKNMKTMFEELGFKVMPHFNKTCSEIEEAFQQASSIQSDILVFVISTYGEISPLTNIKSDGTKVYDQMIFGYDGQPISVNQLLKQLDNDALRGKTKLCFIQAGRSIQGMEESRKFDLGVTVELAGGKQIYKAKFDDKADDMGADGEDETDKGEGYTRGMPKLPETQIEPVKSLDDAKSEIALDKCDSEIAIAPVECPRDCLVMYSDKYGLRSPTKGSWMLHYMFEERHILKQDDGNVLMYLTKVLRKMADRTSTFKGQKVKPCGTIYHRLTREVFMRNK